MRHARPKTEDAGLPQLILASASPRRRALIRRLGLPFHAVDLNTDETVPEMEPPETVRRLAVRKAEAAGRHYPDQLIIGADTAIDLDGRVLGKPADEEEAGEILGRLRDRCHRVWTGLAVLQHQAKRLEVGTVSTSVRMGAYSGRVIEAYIESGEPMDKAGAYAIQGRGADLVDSIEGCYFNVVGFPLCELCRLLRLFGLEPQAGTLCVGPDGPCPRWEKASERGRTTGN